MRQHLMPLTDIEGSEDSDEESLLEDNNHNFQVRWGGGGGGGGEAWGDVGGRVSGRGGGERLRERVVY